MKKFNVIFSFIVFFTSSITLACVVGSAYLQNARDGKALSVCNQEKFSKDQSPMQKGILWYEFFSANAMNKEFVQMVERAFDTKIEVYLKFLKDEEGLIELYSQDVDALSYLAKVYEQWANKESREKMVELDHPPVYLSATEFVEQINSNHKFMCSLSQMNCQQKQMGGLKHVRLAFGQDRTQHHILPLKLEEGNVSGVYELYYIEPNQATQMFFGKASLIKRKVNIPKGDGAIIWQNAMGKSFQVDLDISPVAYSEGLTSTGRLSAPCEAEALTQEHRVKLCGNSGSVVVPDGQGGPPVNTQ